jgi:hypothetical protein
MTGFTIRAAAALALAAAAQDGPAIEEVAADLAYGYCPLFLAGQFPLTGNPQLERFGFASEITAAEVPRMGRIETVTARRADGEIGFGGAPERLCNVTIRGERREAVLARLRRDMPMMGIVFAPDPAQTGDRGGVSVESFKGRADAATMLNVQFLQAGGPVPMVSVQLFATTD